MKSLIPAPLSPGDLVRVVAPARSLKLISPAVQAFANARFEALGLRLSFGKSVHCCDEWLSSSVQERVADLHEAFADQAVKAIFTVIGGSNSNQLLEHLDYGLIAKHPKIFCGFSDITALHQAIYAKTGLVTFYGPHYSTLGMKLGIEWTIAQMQALFSHQPYCLTASQEWSDDPWWLDQDKRLFEPNPGIQVLQEGDAQGTIVGGNLGTFCLLKGTPYMPSLKESILFLEAEEATGAAAFDRLLHSLVQLPEFAAVKALVFGRFQRASQISFETLKKIITNKPQLRRLPILAGVDFGHTTPIVTLPLGGKATLRQGTIQVCITG